MAYDSSPPQTEESALLPNQAPPSCISETTNQNANDEAQKPITPLRGCVIIASLSILIFLQACNFSLLSTTQSTVAADLDAYGEVTWFTSAYLIAMSSVSPLAGRLSQVFSPRLCILVSTLIFAVGSLVTSRADNLAVFLSGRAVAGVGAAGILTISIILAIELTSKKHRGLFIGLANTAVTCGVSLGAVIGGALLEPMGWQALFWLQAVLALPAGLCVFLSIPKGSSASEHGAGKQKLWDKLRRIDYTGAALLITCLVTLLTGLSSPKIQWILVVVSLVLLVLFVVNEAYLAYEPVIPVIVLISRGTLLTCLAQLAFMMARWTVLFYTPVYALAVRQWSPTSAGSILVPTNAGFALGGMLVGWIHIRSSRSFYMFVDAPSIIFCSSAYNHFAQRSTLVCYGAFPITLAILSQISTNLSSAPLYLCVTFANGFATGAALNYAIAHLLHLTLPSTHYIATSLLTTFRGFSGSFGSAIGGGIFTRILQSSLQVGFVERGLVGKEELVRRLLGSPALVTLLAGEEREVAIAAYEDAIKGLFLAGCGLAVLAVASQAGTGWRAPDEKDNPKEPVEEDGEA